MEAQKKQRLITYGMYSLGAVAIVIISCLVLSKDDSTTAQNGEAQRMEIPSPDVEDLPETKQKSYEEAAAEVEYQAQLRSLEEEVFTHPDPNVKVIESKGEQSRSSSSPSRRSSQSIIGDKEFEAEKISNAVQAAERSTIAISQVQQSSSEQNVISNDDYDQVLQLKEQLIDKEAEIQILKTEKEMMQILANQSAQTVQSSETVISEEKENIVTPVNSQEASKVSSLNHRVKNNGFYGVGSGEGKRNTIRGSVYGQQIIENGQNVRLRLLEPMQVGAGILPRGSIIVGVATIGMDRLYISVTSLEHAGIITNVSMEVFDMDGQRGLFMPGSMEQDAGREIGADVTSSISSGATQGLSLVNNQSASEQIKADVSRGLIHGTASFISRKLSVIKVTVQNNHQLYLVTQNSK